MSQGEQILSSWTLPRTGWVDLSTRLDQHVQAIVDQFAEILGALQPRRRTSAGYVIGCTLGEVAQIRQESAEWSCILSSISDLVRTLLDECILPTSDFVLLRHPSDIHLCMDTLEDLYNGLEELHAYLHGPSGDIRRPSLDCSPESLIPLARTVEAMTSLVDQIRSAANAIPLATDPPKNANSKSNLSRVECEA